jgi:hypothetical protein
MDSEWNLEERNRLLTNYWYYVMDLYYEPNLMQSVCGLGVQI